MSASSALIALLVLVVAAPPAIAREDGVSVDPDSPAGVEYAVPLDQARREATGTAGGGSAEQRTATSRCSASESSALPPGAVAAAARRAAVARAAAQAPAAAVQAAATQAGAGEAGGKRRERGGDRGRGQRRLLDRPADAGIAVAVLLLGLLGGLGLRRVLRDN